MVILLHDIYEISFCGVQILANIILVTKNKYMQLIIVFI